MRGGHQRLDRVSATDFQGHDAAESVARVALHQIDGTGNGSAVSEALLPDQGCTHVGHGGNPVVVSEFGRRHELDAMAFLVQGLHVEKPEIGAAPSPRPQHPGANGK